MLHSTAFLNMAMLQNPTLSPQGDAAAIRLIIDVQETGR
jgi:hypothetical protein